jgi:hypothetical protein
LNRNTLGTCGPQTPITSITGGASYIYSGNDATLVYSGGPPPVVEVIGVGGPHVTNIFLFSGVTEPPFAVQRRTS